MGRTVPLIIKLTEIEVRELEEIATKLGVTKQDVIRMMIRLYAPKLIQALEYIKPP